jgi:tetratricopeptide (TPR) repeat protein
MIARSQKWRGQTGSLMLFAAVVCGLVLAPAALGEVPEVEAEEHPSPVSPGDALTSTNLHRTLFKPKPPPVVKDYQHEINTARQLRRNKDHAAAEKMLVTLLEEKPPPEFQRGTLFELALVAQEQLKLPRAQQIFAQYMQLFPQDPTVPEVLLRQGLIFRQMGAYNMAIGKYYAVMNSALGLKLDQFDYYKRLVLQAQTEIADTYYMQGKFSEASDFFARILKQNTTELNRAQIHYKLIRCLASLEKHTEVTSQARAFHEKFPDASESAELRFLCSNSYKALGRTRDAHAEVMKLLKSQAESVKTNPENWVYWQQRAGNDIANQLYLEGDYLNALELYNHLAALNNAPAWQVPIWYQIALIYERLSQPKKAVERYAEIVAKEKDLDAAPSVKTVIDMARWRKEQIDWRDRTELAVQSLRLSPAPTSGTNTASRSQP